MQNSAGLHCAPWVSKGVLFVRLGQALDDLRRYLLYGLHVHHSVRFVLEQAALVKASFWFWFIFRLS